LWTSAEFVILTHRLLHFPLYLLFCLLHSALFSRPRPASAACSERCSAGGPGRTAKATIACSEHRCSEPGAWDLQPRVFESARPIARPPTLPPPLLRRPILPLPHDPSHSPILLHHHPRSLPQSHSHSHTLSRLGLTLSMHRDHNDVVVAASLVANRESLPATRRSMHRHCDVGAGSGFLGLGWGLGNAKTMRLKEDRHGT
jgi:hypothetical protein